MMMIGRRNQNEERFSAHKDDARLDFGLEACPMVAAVMGSP
ncbi:hypothetical protein [Bifidobacterium breve]|nr:hypothetical protein [Bifidobacterium breve]